METDIKQYIALRFKQVCVELKLATTEEDKHKHLRELNKLSGMAAEMFGFDFADSLVEGVTVDV